MIRPVVTTPVADDHIQTIDAWWRANRTAAHGLFAEELAACVELIGRAGVKGRVAVFQSPAGRSPGSVSAWPAIASGVL